MTTQRFCRDVAAEMCAVKVDFFHGCVGGRLRGFQIFAEAVTPRTRPPFVTI